MSSFPSLVDAVHVAELLHELHIACFHLRAYFQRDSENPESTEVEDRPEKRNGRCTVVYGKRASRTKRKLPAGSDTSKEAQSSWQRRPRIIACSTDEATHLDGVLDAFLAILSVARKGRPVSSPRSSLLGSASRVVARAIHLKLRGSKSTLCRHMADVREYQEATKQASALHDNACDSECPIVRIAEEYESITGDHLRQAVLVPHSLEIIFDNLLDGPVPLTLVDGILRVWASNATSLLADEFVQRVFCTALTASLKGGVGDAYLSELLQVVNERRSGPHSMASLSMDAVGFLSEAARTHLSTYQSWALFLESGPFAGVATDLEPLTMIGFLGEITGYFGALAYPSKGQSAGFARIVQELVSRVIEMDGLMTTALSSEAVGIACVLSQIARDAEFHEHLNCISFLLSVYAARLVLKEGQEIDNELAAQINYLGETSHWVTRNIIAFTRRLDILADYAEVFRQLHLFSYELHMISIIYELNGLRNSRYQDMLVDAETRLAGEDRDTKWIHEEILPTYVNGSRHNARAPANIKARGLVPTPRHSSQSTLVDESSDTTDVEDDSSDNQATISEEDNQIRGKGHSRARLPSAVVNPRLGPSHTRPTKRYKPELAARPVIEPSSDDLNLFAIRTPSPRRRPGCHIATSFKIRLVKARRSNN